MKKSIQNFLDTPMTRADFMKNAGAGLVMLFGGNLILQSLKSLSGGNKPSQGTARSYGRNNYGG